MIDEPKIMQSFKNHMNGAMEYKRLNEMLTNEIKSIDELANMITEQTKSVCSKILPNQKKRIDPEWY